jgi:hypothetical protein
MCIVTYTKINGKDIFVKVRDVPSDGLKTTNITIYHELINGVETVYYHDSVSNYVEGFDSNGFGFVNTVTLNKITKAQFVSTLKNNYKTTKTKTRFVQKKNKLLHSIKGKTKKQSINSLKTKGYYDIVGEALIHTDNGVKHIEAEPYQNHFKVNKQTNDLVITNVPISLINNNKQLDKMTYSKPTIYSSRTRKKYMEKRLRNIKPKTKNKTTKEVYNILKNDLLNSKALSNIYKNVILEYNKANVTYPYIQNTLFSIMNFDDLDFIILYNNKKIKKPKYVNKLPKDYIPKIRVILEKIPEQNKKERPTLTNKELQAITHLLD